MTIKVFISSTSPDLKEHRTAVANAIADLHGYMPIEKKTFSAADMSTEEYCQQLVSECDLFIGIIGHLFGHAPDGQDKSFTQLEYFAATGKSRLMFLSAEDFPLAASLIVDASKNWDRQQEFRKLVRNERQTHTDGFNSPDQLALRALQAIHKWHQESRTKMALERAETLQVFLREMLFKPDEDRELHETLKRLTEALATTLKVERVSIWRYALEPTRIVCRYFHPKSSGMEGEDLHEEDYANYFKALKKSLKEQAGVLDVSDACTDSRTADLRQYLKLHRVTAMLDVPIKVRGNLWGIICHEHVGDSARKWSLEEKTFAISVANVVALALEQLDPLPSCRS